MNTFPGLEAVAEAAHAELWRRLLDPQWGTLYDYGGLTGEVCLPTPEECVESRPNALSWWTPIENGAFFGGLYLHALCRRWQHRRDAATARDAATVAGGLLRLAEVGRAPGFVARGVAADGQAHYLAGSDDQTLPWFYGLWQYARSGLPSAAERARVVDKVVKVGEALEAASWRLPCDRMGFGHRGTFVEPNFIHAARLLFVLRALHDLSGDEFWLQRYRQRLTEPLEGTTRQALVAAGAGYGLPGGPTSYPTNPPFWISVSSHACLAALLELETDEAVAGAYREGLTRDATAALPHLALARELRADEQVFDIDWRKLNALWSPQATIAEAVALAERQVREWNRMAPRRGLEHRHLREPQFAAWLVALAGGELVWANREAMARTLTCCRWPELYTSFFTAELVYWQVGPGSWAA